VLQPDTIYIPARIKNDHRDTCLKHLFAATLPDYFGPAILLKYYMPRLTPVLIKSIPIRS
jgi:hypothetical protein